MLKKAEIEAAGHQAAANHARFFPQLAGPDDGIFPNPVQDMLVDGGLEGLQQVVAGHRQFAAAGYINQIRQRAYGAGYPRFATSDFATTELAILHERDKEFVAEGCRWFDVVRMHDASHKPLVFSADAAYPAMMGGAATPILSSSESHKLLWPVNATVLANDPKLQQTVGY